MLAVGLVAARDADRDADDDAGEQDGDRRDQPAGAADRVDVAADLDRLLAGAPASRRRLEGRLWSGHGAQWNVVPRRTCCVCEEAISATIRSARSAPARRAPRPLPSHRHERDRPGARPAPRPWRRGRAAPPDGPFRRRRSPPRRRPRRSRRSPCAGSSPPASSRGTTRPTTAARTRRPPAARRPSRRSCRGTAPSRRRPAGPPAPRGPAVRPVARDRQLRGGVAGEHGRHRVEQRVDALPRDAAA